jgi:fused signal recognition particle receptor
VFKKLRESLLHATSALASAIKEKAVTRELRASDVEPILENLKIELVESEVAFDVAELIALEIEKRLVGTRIPRGTKVEELVRNTLKEVLLHIVGLQGFDLIEEAKKKCKPGDKPFVVVFLGVNGVGKTTTIAKIGYKAKREGLTPVLAAADTFRAGAQEQLRVHAEKLSVPFIGGRYGSDPASVAFDAIEYARARNYCLVLVDTAGRMHTDYDLMGELRKIIRVTKPDAKVLVVDALTGNDAIEQARIFNEEVGVDGIIITKTDADVKGGVAISVAAITRKPILYIGTGQEYSDLKRFEPKEFVENLLS